MMELLRKNLQASHRVRSVLGGLCERLDVLEERGESYRREINYKHAMTMREMSKDNETLRASMASIRRELYSLRQSRNTLQNSEDGPDRQDMFRLFPRLPPELRIKIWKIASFNEPRVVQLRVDTQEDGGLCSFYCPGNYPPPILHATSESRTEALRYYKRKRVEFCKYYGGFFRDFAPTAQTYFNFDIDILYPIIDDNWTLAFADNWVEVLTKHRTLRQFRRVAIANSVFGDTDDYDEMDLEWSTAVRFLSKPRSKIEEIMVVRDGHLPLETEQQLIPLSDDDEIWTEHAGPYRETVASRMDTISDYLRGFDDSDESDIPVPDDWDGDIRDDGPSDGEESAPIIKGATPAGTRNVASEAGEGADAQQDGQKAQPRKRKPPLKVRYMGLRDPNRLPLPRITLV